MNLIAIIDRNWGIAKDGKQICAIPADMRHFRELTMGGTVVMGRKTFEAIGKPLEGRWNIMLSRRVPIAEGITVVWDISRVREIAGDAFIIGGESIYRQLLPYCDRAYITAMGADLNADQFCPDLDEDDEWEISGFGKIEYYGDLPYQFREYRRVSHGQTD